LVESEKRNLVNSTEEGIMAKQQPSDTKEFKQEAVPLVETSKKSKSARARDLGIADRAFSKWCKAVGNHGDQAFPGKGHQRALEEEVRRLHRENEVRKQERDLVQNAVRIFVQPQP
jgi:transposase